jgi:hypothetical protein
MQARLKRWLYYAVLCGVVAGSLAGFSKNEGVIPINKNLWSLRKANKFSKFFIAAAGCDFYRNVLETNFNNVFFFIISAAASACTVCTALHFAPNKSPAL